MDILKLTFLILLLGGCVTAPQLEISENSELNQLEGLNNCNFNFQCKKLYTGYNPCGAHTGYLTYSTLIGKENIANLKKAVLRDRAAEETAYLAANGDLIECQPAFTLWPNPICLSNQCVMK